MNLFLQIDVYDVGIQRSLVRSLKLNYSCDTFHLNKVTPVKLKELIQAFQ
jgi:hypothetical protein